MNTIQQIETFSKSLNSNSSNNNNNNNNDYTTTYNSFLDCILIISTDVGNTVLFEQLINKLSDSNNNNNNNNNKHFIKLILISIQRIIQKLNNNEQTSKLVSNLFNVYFELLSSSSNQFDNSIMGIIIENITNSIFIIVDNESILNNLLEISNQSMKSIYFESNDHQNQITIGNYNTLFSLLNKIYTKVNKDGSTTFNGNEIMDKYRDIFIKNSIELLKVSTDQDIRNSVISTLLLPLINNNIVYFKLVKEVAYKMISDPPESLFASTIKSEGFKLISNLFNNDTFYKELIIDPIFWESIIDGLGDMNDPLNRKRSSYLLKRSIKVIIEIQDQINDEDWKWTEYFKWNKESNNKLEKLWNTFFLIYESLDDFTIHLIQPIWKEIDSLIIPSSSSSGETLNFKWIELLFKRALNHMNPAVIKVLIIDVLNSNKYIPWLPLNFICGSLMNSISNPALFKGITESTIHISISNFFKCYYKSSHSCSNVKDKSNFIILLFKSIIDNHLQRELFVDLLKFIENVTNDEKLQLSVIDDQFYKSTLSTLFEVSIKRLHSNNRNRIYKSLIKSLIYLTGSDNGNSTTTTTTIGFDTISKIIYSIPLHFHTNLKYHQILNDWIYSISNINQILIPSIQLILKNYKQVQLDPTTIIDKDLIIKIKQDSFIFSRIISYLNDSEFKLILNQILSEIKSIINGGNDDGINSISFFKNIILLGSILSITELDSQISILKPLFEIEESFSVTFLEFLSKSKFTIDFIPLLEIEESLYLIQSFIIENINVNENYKSNLINYVNKLLSTSGTSTSISVSSTLSNISNEINKLIKIQRFFGIFKQRCSNLIKLFTIDQIEQYIDFIINIEIVKPKTVVGEGDDQPHYSIKETFTIWGNINSYFIKTKWMLVRNLLTILAKQFLKSSSSSPQESKMLNENSCKYLDILVEDLNGSNFYCSQPIFHCLTILLPIGAKNRDQNGSNIGFNQDIFEKVLSYAWTSVIDSGTLTFIGSFIQLIYQHDILSVLITDEQVDENGNEIFNHHNLLKEYFYKLLKQADLVVGLYNLLVMNTTTIWKQYPEIAKLYIDEIYESLVFGPVRSTGNELHLDTEATIELPFYDPLVGVPTFVFNLHQDSICESEKDQITFGFGSVPIKDSYGRAVCSVFLYEMGKLSIDINNDNHSRIEFINLISMKLLNSNFSNELSKKKEYLLNTPVHRLKIRVWQSLCILSKFIQPESNDQLNEIGTSLVKIFHLFNLPSVRKYVNIFLVCFMKKHLEIIEIHLIGLLDNLNLRGDILSSIVVTAGYILLNINDNGGDNKLYQSIFNRVLSLSTSAHQVVKTIASSIIFQLYQEDYNILSNRLEPGLMEYLKQLCYFLKTNQQAFNSLEKQKQQMNLKIENQFTDSSFSNLFYDTPVLEQLSTSEIISPSILEFLLDSGGNQQIEKEIRDKLIEKSKYLPDVIGAVISKQEKEDITITTTTTVVNNTSNINDGDIDEYIENNPTSYQKKILPWSNDLDLESRDHLISKSRQSLIVVASFVDKIPNLAGLARTCEIFNVESLVVSDLKITNDPGFQNITVSAEKWLPMEEVPEESLKQYMLEKKSQGYSLLGVEQTSSSVELNTFVFPEKSVLLLGKEKEGIPTEYINLLDKCVIVPQLGVTRSLNVHVCASLAIWNYTQQKLNQ